MASQRIALPVKRLFNGFGTYQESARRASRSMATETPLPQTTLSQPYLEAHLNSAPTQQIFEDQVSVPSPTPRTSDLVLPQRFQAQKNPFVSTAQCTLYDFPSMEPVRFVTYPSTHLLLPTRRDILHKAVVYEADCERQGTASTKWRSEVHGSGRKLRPQKGTGKARLGDRKSPMLRGGGVAFGPKPRDFSTELPRKIYDLAWRTALSYRYKKGELIVTNGSIDVQGVEASSLERFTRDILRWNGLGQSAGKTLFITSERREGLFSALEGDKMDREATALPLELVDVRDLLKSARLVVERRSLELMFAEHEEDLSKAQRWSARRLELRT